MEDVKLRTSRETPRVVGLWWGGHSYAIGGAEDLEGFASIQAAKGALDRRRRHGYSYRQHFEFLNREPEDNLCPTVGDESELWLWLDADPATVIGSPPDRVVKFGPRSGVVVERT